MENRITKQIIEEKDKLTINVKKEPAEGKSTSSKLTITKDLTVLQTKNCHLGFEQLSS